MSLTWARAAGVLGVLIQHIVAHVMPRLQAVWPQPLLPHPGGFDGTLTCCDML